MLRSTHGVAGDNLSVRNPAQHRVPTARGECSPGDGKAAHRTSSVVVGSGLVAGGPDTRLRAQPLGRDMRRHRRPGECGGPEGGAGRSEPEAPYGAGAAGHTPDRGSESEQPTEVGRTEHSEALRPSGGGLSLRVRVGAGRPSAAQPRPLARTYAIRFCPCIATADAPAARLHVAPFARSARTPCNCIARVTMPCHMPHLGRQLGAAHALPEWSPRCFLATPSGPPPYHCGPRGRRQEASRLACVPEGSSDGLL